MTTGIPRQSLLEMGLIEQDIDRFLHNEPIAYHFAGGTSRPIAILQREGVRLRSGLLLVDDPGLGVFLFLRFRNQSFRVARDFNLSEVELFGAEVINIDLANLLRRRGFTERRGQSVPEELEGGTMTILSRIFAVDPT